MPRKTNKTDPRNRATPVDRLRGAAKQARINRVTQVEAGPQTYKASPMTSAGVTGRRPAIQAQGQSRGVGRLGIPLAIVAEVMRARPTAPGTLPASEARRVEAQRTQGAEFSRQERMARQGNKGRENSSFDNAFAAARKAGVETFSWRGRKYNTKMKGE